MRVYLKMKIMSLAAEARIIRREEKRWPGPSSARFGLREHRINDVRKEARAALLAYGFLRGRALREIERTHERSPDWQRVAELVKKYGSPAQAKEQLPAWIESGKERAAA